MNGDNNTLLKLKDGKFIEIFKIENLDDSIFRNYQRYDFHQVLWFTKVQGKGKYFIDFRDFSFSENEIIVVFPGQIDKLDLVGKEGYLIAIDNETFFSINQFLNSDYLNGYHSNIFIRLNESVSTILNSLMHLIMTEYTSANRMVLMESYMSSFLYHVVATFERMVISKEMTDSTVYQQIAELMRLIDIHFIEEREIAFYAEKLGLTHKRISEISIKGTGHTVKYLINERLLLEMKKEIKLGKKSFKEIAFELGFSEPAYFSRFFKQYTSQTPKEFRNNS